MFIFEGLKQTQEDRVEVQRNDSGGILVVSVFIDGPEAVHMQLRFTKVVFFARSIFPGPGGVDCDMSRYRLQLGHVSCLGKSDLAAIYTEYYSKNIFRLPPFKHFIIIFDGIGEILHIIAQAFLGRSIIA